MTAIKCLVLLILLLGIAAAVGLAGCRMTGADAHVHEMVLAFSVALVAAIIAIVPLLRGRSRLDTADAFQAALIGSVIHLALVLMIAGALLVVKRVNTPFVLWLLGGYWATLIGLCVTFARMIRTAPKALAREG